MSAKSEIKSEIKAVAGLAGSALGLAADLIVPPAVLLLKVLQRRCRETVIDHWHDYVENFQMDPLEFYELLYHELNRRQIPGLKSFCVTHGEGGIGTPDRLYLRLDRQWGKFDICAAPFGTGFFFSYRYIVSTPIGFLAKLLLGIVIIHAVSVGLMTAGVVGIRFPTLAPR